MTATVAALHTYPVKSLGGSTHETVEVLPEGPAGDRRWMIVDETGRFLTQREHAPMATIRATWNDGGLHLAADGLDLICAAPDGVARREVVVWRDSVDAAAASDDADAALSEWFGRQVHLVYMDERAQRSASVEWAGEGAPVSFADGYPLLIAGCAALDDLNARIQERGGKAVPMARFRPNVEISGLEAWADDAWSVVRVGDVTFDIVKPCVRCIITTTDQKTGRRPSDEPLRTLATFRRSKDQRVRGVLFGWNAVPRGPGRIAVGDALEVVERRHSWSVG